jgi:hypothetical protein
MPHGQGVHGGAKGDERIVGQLDPIGKINRIEGERFLELVVVRGDGVALI